MNTKSLLQILAPFAVTIALFLAFWIVSAIFWLGVSIFDFSEGLPLAFEVNIFDFDERTTFVFWIINIILIILTELWLSAEEV